MTQHEGLQSPPQLTRAVVGVYLAIGFGYAAIKFSGNLWRLWADFDYAFRPEFVTQFNALFPNAPLRVRRVQTMARLRLLMQATIACKQALGWPWHFLRDIVGIFF
jgi:hypothetical protein